ncbi:MAG: hypothetical protein ACXW1F_07250, partial [Halobacteriota archaeon]
EQLSAVHYLQKMCPMLQFPYISIFAYIDIIYSCGFALSRSNMKNQQQGKGENFEKKAQD